MYFNEKLQLLRKDNNMTQEELAEKLYVSRTAVSKWESGKGYPNIDSLKNISRLFSVSIDELISDDKRIIMPKSRNKTDIEKKCGFIYGVVDFLMPLFVFVPVFGKNENGFIKSVSLFCDPDISQTIKMLYCISFFVLMLFGIVEFTIKKKANEYAENFFCYTSVGMSTAVMLLFINSRQPYMSTLFLVIIMIKLILLVKTEKLSNCIAMTRKVS